MFGANSGRKVRNSAHEREVHEPEKKLKRL